MGPALIYADEGARPLEELAAKAPLDIDTVLTIGASIAEAVAALHKERLVHCNLNPTTVWLNEAGDGALISDFGCARQLSEEQGGGMPPCDELIDLKYMSPEQTGRLQTIIDQRTDIYSLGIILFRLLTGKVPFDGADPLQIIDGHVARQPIVPGGAARHAAGGTCQGGLEGAGEESRGPLPERQRARCRPARMSLAVAFHRRNRRVRTRAPRCQSGAAGLAPPLRA